MEHQNGVIEEYSIQVTGVDTTEKFELSTNDTNITVFSLHPFYTYKFAVAAHTIALGPFSSPVNLQMPAAGIPLSISLLDIATNAVCLLSIQLQPYPQRTLP